MVILSPRRISAALQTERQARWRAKHRRRGLVDGDARYRASRIGTQQR
jgi:hypothetical protein